MSVHKHKTLEANVSIARHNTLLCFAVSICMLDIFMCFFSNLYKLTHFHCYLRDVLLSKYL